MAEVIPFPKPNHRKVPRLCCDMVGPSNWCSNEATRYVAYFQMEPVSGVLTVVGSGEPIYKYFCEEHAPADAERLEFNKEEN